ncbi:MAG: hypothetical protein L0L52_03860 [Staphylococcus equorum]|nr:hypothetical protein [Staphylococcus equorum]MDN6721355.1 hypothetical protein [Staphylococcus equorum]MDN6741276.1 hypothetical protein [Staphylococcus equorum]
MLWCLVIFGCFILVFIYYYLSLIKKSLNRFNDLTYYLNLHIEHLYNLNNGEVNNRKANEILFKGSLISVLIKDVFVLDQYDIMNPSRVQDKIIQLQNNRELEDKRLNDLKNPKYAIERTLSLPARLLNIVIPIQMSLGIKYLINFIFWVLTVLIPFVTKVMEILQNYIK